MIDEVIDRDTIFTNAIAIASAKERETFLAQACGDDEALRQHLAERVAAHFQAASAHTAPVAAVAPASYQTGKNGDQHPVSQGNGAAFQGSCIGPYKLLQCLGESVKDIVFLAEQQQPARRMVALKIIKPGMDAQSVLARFEAERHALARLNHPNVARVFDAGIVPGSHGNGDGAHAPPLPGRPYFVMELVKGIPITQYCDEHRLSLQQRLELFVAVCQAVQHAHQKGVLHGDLRPSHVLVSSINNKPVPRVTDFGVASATAQKLTERAAPSAGGYAGTLEYLSPEQAQFNALDVDTRSDVYSLGVLLYELLTGTTPLPRQRLKEVALTEALRLIQEEKALPPSTRLNESRDRLATLATQRQMDPVVLVKAVRGELDSIVMKALQNDRTQRYDTASELARDIQRYLADEPVDAYPGNSAYRLRKLARKHRRTAKLSTVLLVLLLASGVVGTLMALSASHAQAEARAAVKEAEEKRTKAEKTAEALTLERDQADAARKGTSGALDRALAAEATAKEAEQDLHAVVTFLEDRVFSAGRPKTWAGAYDKDVTLRKAVDAAEPEVAKTFAGRPLVVAALREVLGATYLDLDEAERAVKQYEQAFTLRQTLQGPEHPDTMSCRNNLARAYRHAGRTVEAGALYNHNVNALAHATSLAKTGAQLLAEKKPAEAEAKLRESLAIRQRLLANDWTTFDARSLLGEALLSQKKYAAAEPLLLTSYEGLKRRATDIPADARVRVNRAVERLVRLYESWNKADEAARWRKELETVKAAGNS